MIDVFFRTVTSKDPVRSIMTELAWERWLMEPIQLLDVVDYSIREAREYAEANASSDPYIFTDDDVLIMGTDWVKRAVEIMLRHPEYAIVSTLSIIEGENQAKGEGEIYEMHAVGAPMLIRKGICVNLPEMTLDNECGTLHKFVLDKGFKMGLLNGTNGNPLRHNHLGHGFSSNPALRWAY